MTDEGGRHDPGCVRLSRPASLPEAIALLSRFGDSAKVISGGQSLLPLLKLRLGAAEHLVDIGRIAGLEYVREEGGSLRIGGRTRESVLERSEVVRARYPILLDTARVIADPLVRNRATVGGNLAHGDPANDHPATMLALRAEVVAFGQNGERAIPSTSSSPASFPPRSPGRDPDRDPDPGSSQTDWRGVREARTEGWRLRNGRGGSAGDPGRERSVHAGGAGADERRPDAAPLNRGRGVLERAESHRRQHR